MKRDSFADQERMGRQTIEQIVNRIYHSADDPGTILMKENYPDENTSTRGRNDVPELDRGLESDYESRFDPEDAYEDSTSGFYRSED